MRSDAQKNTGRFHNAPHRSGNAVGRRPRNGKRGHGHELQPGLARAACVLLCTACVAIGVHHVPVGLVQGLSSATSPKSRASDATVINNSSATLVMPSTIQR